MEQIYPLHEDNIKQFCGMTVCVVTNDGARHVGVLSRCHEGRIMLNERPQTAAANATVGVQQGKVTNQKSKKSKKGKSSVDAKTSKTKESAQTQAFYPYDPYGYGGNGWDGWDGGFGFGDALAFDLASIAFLFLLI